MPRALATSNRSQRPTQEGNMNSIHEESIRLDDRPLPQSDTPPADNREENSRPSGVQLPVSSGISNSGPPRPSDSQGHTSESSPGDSLAAKPQNEAQEDQPSPSEIVNVMKEVLEVLKDSTIASKSGKDERSRFWGLYKRVAEEHDDEFLERYNSDMDIVLVFSGLFSAVSTTFIVAMEPSLSPDPNDTTHALLTQLVQIGLGNFTAAGSAPATPASNWSPPISNIRIQSIAYASLSFSLLAAFGAVLGKQWLGYYKSQRYGRGSQEERAKRRQEKFDGIVTWYFDAVMQSFPVLLQISLLLFGIALSANMWSQQHTIARVIIATTVFGFMFYSLTVMVALVSPACPFQTPISTILRMMQIDRLLRPVVKLVLSYVQKSISWVHDELRFLMTYADFHCFLLDVWHRLHWLHWLLFRALRRSWTEFYEDPARAVRSFARYCVQSLLGALRRIARWLRSLVFRAPTSVVDTEAQHSGQNLHAVETIELILPDIPTSSLEAPSIKWLLETFTDPEVFLATASLVPHVDWPLDLDVSDTLHQLYDVYMSCLDVQKRVVPSLEDKASASAMALCHLYCGRILQGHPALGFDGQGSSDGYVFRQMLERTKVTNDVFVATIKLLHAKNASWFPSLKFGACPDSVLEWLSHTLPFHFVIEQVDKDVEELAITVISKLLCSSSSPSPQIIANCALLACIMVGVQFDKKDIIRVDKSSALHQLAQCLWKQFQKVLGASGEGISGRAAWHFDIICRVLDNDLPDLRPPAEMWNLGVCWKIYTRARLSEQNNWDSLAPLSTVQRFRFVVDDVKSALHPAWLWQHRISWQSNSHSPEDVDWLVDYLGDVCSNDHATAGDILLLLSSMSVSCSPAKQRPYIEMLSACMSSSMPPRLRHAALRAAHSFREVLASIDIVDDADIVLTNFSSAILTAVCPQPGATPTDTGPDRFFDDDRDLCYLQLIFGLARNSQWHPRLYCQIDRAIGMIAACCNLYGAYAFYLVGIFLRTTSEEVSNTSLSSITERQWWDMMRNAWYFACRTIDSAYCVEFLPILVKGTKKYMHIASERDLKHLIKDVDDLIRRVESRDLLEHKERVVAAMKEMSDVTKDTLAKIHK